MCWKMLATGKKVYKTQTVDDNRHVILTRCLDSHGDKLDTHNSRLEAMSKSLTEAYEFIMKNKSQIQELIETIESLRKSIQG